MIMNVSIALPWKKKLQSLNSDLLEENAALQEELTQLTSRTITTMVNGKYTEEVRLCVMDLLSHNVGIKRVEPIIRAVLKLANVTCHQLPQPTAISDMLLEGRVLSQIQLAETLTASENNTLHSDGTTKFGHKYSSFQVSMDDKSMTLGIQVCCVHVAGDNNIISTHYTYRKWYQELPKLLLRHYKTSWMS